MTKSQNNTFLYMREGFSKTRLLLDLHFIWIYCVSCNTHLLIREVEEKYGLTIANFKKVPTKVCTYVRKILIRINSQFQVPMYQPHLRPPDLILVPMTRWHRPRLGLYSILWTIFTAFWRPKTKTKIFWPPFWKMMHWGHYSTYTIKSVPIVTDRFGILPPMLVRS